MKARWFIAILVVVFGARALEARHDESGQDWKPSVPARAFEREVPAPKAVLTTTESRSLVSDFYSSLHGFSYRDAWRSLTVPVRDEFGGLDNWKQGHDSSLQTDLTDVWIERTGRLDATAHVDIRTVDLDTCDDRVVQHFKGTWAVEERGGRHLLDDPQIEKTSGPDPVSVASDCPSEYSAPPTAGAAGSYGDQTESEGSSGYGGGANDYGSDGSGSEGNYTYDPPDPYYGSSGGEDLGPGNGYTVTCEDGSISHSGGIQGACSYHGGEAGQ